MHFCPVRLVEQPALYDNKPALRVAGLRKRYGPLEVLKGVSLTARRGDVIAILGSSGSGKSTLLRCLNLLERPSDGHIWLGDTEIGHSTGLSDRRKIEALRARMGMVFQTFNLWPHKTVLENIVEAPVHVRRLTRSDASQKAKDLLCKVGLFDKQDAFPTHLSGGQQQRVAIARALAMEPEILLFDEPTSALDPELVGEVLKVMRELAEEGRTMLIVTHELNFARQVSSHTMFLHHGRVEEHGNTRELFASPSSPRFRDFLSAQAGGGAR